MSDRKAPMPVPPDDLAFSRSFFGYDPLEVRAFVSQMNERLERLQGRQDPPSAGNGDRGAEDLGVVIDSVVGDIARVLESARDASRRIRERAEQEASDMLAAASEQVRKMLASAESDAFALRKSAWDTSTQVLESTKAEGGRLRAVAERDALDIIGNAERKAHRKLAAARRDSENAIQAASAEGDRLLGLARTRAQEVIRAAEERADSAGQRVSAMEKRHGELQQEVESFTARLEGPSGGSESDRTTTVRVVPPSENESGGNGSAVDQEQPVAGSAHAGNGQPADGERISPVRTVGWADGTGSVRVVDASAVRTKVEVDALELSDEVGRLRRKVSDRTREAPTTDAQGNGEQTRRRSAGLVTAPSSPASRGVVVRKPSDARVRAGEVEQARQDDLAALFLDLRMKEDTTARGPVDDSRSRRLPSPLELYDRKLLPVTNRALRAVKRRLIDIEREQVETIEEDSEGWTPDRSKLAPPLVHVLTVMEREAFERGHSSAVELMSTRLPISRDQVDTQGSTEFVAGLFDEAVAAVRNARDAGHTNREIARALSRVYRLWRTDEAERRLRFLAGRSYHRGLFEALRKAGVEEFRVEVHKGCARCAALAGRKLAAPDVPAVPADTDCRCLVLPA